MGFKRITKKDMETSINQNILGNPLKISEKLEKDIELERESKIKKVEQLTSAQISNEEVLKFSYYNSGELKNLDGYGTISIVNISSKDRIWETNLSIAEGSKTDLETDSIMKIGNLEPEENKNIEYVIKKENNLEEPLKITENVTVLNKNISEKSLIESNKKEKNILIFGNKNTIEYKISLENITSYSLKNITFIKGFSREFKDFYVKSDEYPKIDIKLNQIHWSISELRPKEKAFITITADILPEKKELIRTGEIEVNFSLDNIVLSGTKVKEFSAYTHAMHSIRKKEKEKEPNLWECNLLFKNNSNYNLLIKEISVLDDKKEKNYYQFDSNSLESHIKLSPGEKYETENWEVKDEKEPHFSRKISYSITCEEKKSSKILVTVDDNKFDIVDMELNKTFSEKELKSFEESNINNKLVIKNIGTIPINALMVREVIPGDFIAPNNLDDYKIRLSSGLAIQDNLNISINPPNDDPSSEHVMELSLNLQNMKPDFLINLNEFVEIKYKIKAVTPDYSKKYDFPMEIISYFSANPNVITTDELIEAKYALEKYKEPKIHIIHQRRNVEIGKEIFPGRNVEEFGINIHIINKSEIEATDVNISDNIPINCEIVSSNTEYKIKKSDDNVQTLSFKINSILPYEEKEIRYYLKSVSGKSIDYAELESYIIS